MDALIMQEKTPNPGHQEDHSCSRAGNTLQEGDLKTGKKVERQRQEPGTKFAKPVLLRLLIWDIVIAVHSNELGGQTHMMGNTVYSM